ncbi:MAG: hypothetical protein FP831_03850 [Anaerolineae bacterium]|nr:hypothetical protein [Anaerolineae bacterium]
MIEQLKRLEGKTLETLDQHKKFTILTIDHSGIYINVHSTQKDRQLFREQFIDSWDYLLKNGEMTAVHVLDQGCHSSAYVVAILAEIAGVTYTIRPIHLRYSK